MKWSNCSSTRAGDKCGPADVALGYLEQANKVLCGEIKLGDSREERLRNLQKAANVIRSCGKHDARVVDRTVWLGQMRVKEDKR